MLNVAVAGERSTRRRKSKSSELGSAAASQVSEVAQVVDYKSQPFDNFSHVIYEKAALIYVYLKGEADALLPTFEDERVKRRAYSLAFGAKKYESVLNDILLDSYFFSSYFKLEANYRNHVMVMLLDYQQNDFQFGTARSTQQDLSNKDDDSLPHIAEIQEALELSYIKLRASLARNRIRECALTVDDLLPAEEKEKSEYVIHQPIYAYANLLRTSIDDVCYMLEESGFTKLETIANYSEFSGKYFAIDVHFKDLIVFPRDVKFDVYNHDLVQRGCLVVQDKSRCVAPEVVRGVLFQLKMAKEKAASLIPGEIRPVFGEGDDVIVVNADSGNLIARVSSYVHPERTVFVFGVQPDNIQELQAMLQVLGVRNVVLLEESFIGSFPNDERFRKVRVILHNALCSKSGVTSPLDYVLQEGATCVHDLVNGVQATKLRGLVMKHHEILKHAMNFHFVHYIVYFTSSAHGCENEDMIKNVVAENHSESLNKTSGNPFNVTSFLPDLTEKLRAFKATGFDDESSVCENTPYSGMEKYLKLTGKMGVNGGFVCLLQRQKLVDSAKDVLERAAKKGLMKGTKRVKKSPVLKTEDIEKKTVDTPAEDDLPEQMESLEIGARDEKEPAKEKRSKSRRKKNAEPKPFIFK